LLKIWEPNCKMEPFTEIKIADPFKWQKLRADFPILSRTVYGRPLIYLDNAATTQKPVQVIDKINQYYTELNSNIHRGVHFLSEKASKEYEDSREKVRSFIHAGKIEEVVFTRGTTEAINLVASSYGRKNINKDDEIIISTMEHHSNIVPWQMLCEEKGAILRVVPIDDKGEIIIEEYIKLFNERTRFVSIVHISNSLGTINPVKELIEIAHRNGVPILIDGAQAVQHIPVNVQDLDCDFYTFSSHKLYGPSGVGVLYGKENLLESMPPYQGGGDMIRSVTFEKTLYNDLPFKFEAGTPNIEGAIGLGAAIDYVLSVGFDFIGRQENLLLQYATEVLSGIPELRIIGNASDKSSLVSFVVGNVHPHDIGSLLDRKGIAIRTGHHCTQPVMKRYGVPATSRASFAFYNSVAEIDVMAEELKSVIKMFS
jgi:cysteine desulfurase/selenocysteine lyase